jgi:hypothetical protein
MDVKKRRRIVMYNPKPSTTELICPDQPYEVAHLVGYKRNDNCNYCGIDFVAKPNQIRFEYNPICGLSVDIIWDKPILSRFIGNEKIYFAIVGPNPNTRVLRTTILEVVEIMCTDTDESFGITTEAKYHCNRLNYSDPGLICRVQAAYKRNFLDNCELSVPLYGFSKSSKRAITLDARNYDNGVRESFEKDIQRLSNAILKGLGDTHMLRSVPIITRCIINDPAVVVFWSDDTKTVGKCMGDDEFNPEIGLAMAISRKFYEIVGFPNPRSAFRNQLKNAEDRSAKTKERRERKSKLLEEANTRGANG